MNILSPFTKPTAPAAPTPAEAQKIWDNLASLATNHAAQKAARQRELIDLIGDADVSAVMAKTPERFSEVSADVLNLQGQISLSDTAAQSARKRLREIAVPMLTAIRNVEGELRKAHENARIFVLTRAQARISKVVGEDYPAPSFNLLVKSSADVRAQYRFEEVFSANVEAPIRCDMFPDGTGSSETLHEDAFENPLVVSTCFHRLAANLKAANERFAALKESAKREDSENLSEVETLRKENADLRALLALKR